MPQTKDDIIFDNYVIGQMLLERTDWSSTRNYTTALRAMLADAEEKLPKLRGDKRKKLLKAKVFIKNNLEQIYDNYSEDLEDDKLNSAQVGVNTVGNAFNESYGLDKPAFSQIPKNAIAIWESLNTPIEVEDANGKARFFKPKKEINKLFKQHNAQYQRIIRQALFEGLGQEETVRAFKAEVGRINGVKESQIRAITRTSINDTMSRAREYTEQRYFSEVIKAYEWVAILDTRTSPQCASRAGVIKKEWREKPPLHYNCRSVTVAVTQLTDTKQYESRTRIWTERVTGTRSGELRTRFDVATDKIQTFKRPDGRTRYTVFDEWFKTLPESRKVQWMGPQKYKLYQAGKLGTKQLIDGEGRIRTVKELATLIGADTETMREIRRRDLPAYKPKVSRSAQRIIDERAVV